MEDLGVMGEDEFMFTMDVVALYPSVPREKAKKAMKKNLEARRSKKIDRQRNKSENCNKKNKILKRN